MNTPPLSTLSFWSAPRAALPKLQSQLAKASAELGSGRYADVGLAIGGRVEDTINLRRERSELEAIKNGNALVGAKLDMSAASLQLIRKTTEDFMTTLIAMPPTRDGALIAEDAMAHLDAMIQEINKVFGGEYLFGGRNNQIKPLTVYSKIPGAESASKIAVNEIFEMYFAFPQSDTSRVRDITPDEMTGFLEGTFSNTFLDDANWAKWSSAGGNSKAWISPTEQVEASSNANERAIRQVAMAYVMASDLGIEGMREDTRHVLLDKVIQVLGSAGNGLVRLEGRLDVTSKRVNDTSDRIDVQRYVFDVALGRLESVDPAEAKTRIDELTMRIQMSYYMTSEIRNISLLNYL